MSDLQPSRDVLLAELGARQRKNPSYSMRSFARSLGVSPSYLSLVFRGQRRLTSARAHSFARKLEWSAVKRRYFGTLVEFETCRSDAEKALLTDELVRLAKLTREVPSLQIDQFKIIAEWHHSAILALLTLPRFNSTCDGIAERLALSQAQCATALQRLKRLALVQERPDGRWTSTHQTLHVDSTPSAAIRAYHKEVLERAGVALSKQGFNDRDFSNIVFTADPSRLRDAKKRIKQFQRELAELLEGRHPTAVYQFSMQLFRADRSDEGESK